MPMLTRTRRSEVWIPVCPSFSPRRGARAWRGAAAMRAGAAALGAPVGLCCISAHACPKTACRHARLERATTRDAARRPPQVTPGPRPCCPGFGRYIVDITPGCLDTLNEDRSTPRAGFWLCHPLYNPIVAGARDTFKTVYVVPAGSGHLGPMRGLKNPHRVRPSARCRLHCTSPSCTVHTHARPF